jgi:hypothetical protein
MVLTGHVSRLRDLRPPFLPAGNSWPAAERRDGEHYALKLTANAILVS